MKFKDLHQTPSPATPVPHRIPPQLPAPRRYIELVSERERDEARGLGTQDIELDQVLQDKESSLKEMEASAEDVHEELTRVKQERDQLGFSALSGHIFIKAHFFGS